MQNEIVEFIQPADDAPGRRCFTRERRNAHLKGENGTADITLTINATDDFSGFYVRSSTNRGNGWARAKRSPTFATEVEARTWADSKWATLRAWLSDVDAVAGPTASQIWSEQRR